MACMVTERYRFECHDVADCDVIIYSEFEESIYEAARSHLKDVHRRDVSDEDVAPYIEAL
jgi:predicted small metal-binding protein